MLKLIIDTSISKIKLALLKDKEVFTYISEDINIQAEQLAVKLDHLLKKNHADFKEVREIYTIIGPGSFTGIRVAIAFVKGLVLEQNIIVRAVTNFELYFAQYIDEVKNYNKIGVFIHCGKNKYEYYFQEIARDMSSFSLPKIVDYDKINIFTDFDMVISDFYPENFLRKKNYHLLDSNYLRIENIFYLKQQNLKSQFEPLYIRPTYVK